MSLIKLIKENPFPSTLAFLGLTASVTLGCYYLSQNMDDYTYRPTLDYRPTSSLELSRLERSSQMEKYRLGTLRPSIQSISNP